MRCKELIVRWWTNFSRKHGTFIDELKLCQIITTLWLFHFLIETSVSIRNVCGLTKSNTCWEINYWLKTTPLKVNFGIIVSKIHISLTLKCPVTETKSFKKPQESKCNHLYKILTPTKSIKDLITRPKVITGIKIVYNYMFTELNLKIGLILTLQPHLQLWSCYNVRFYARVTTLNYRSSSWLVHCETEVKLMT